MLLGRGALAVVCFPNVSEWNAESPLDIVAAVPQNARDGGEFACEAPGESFLQRMSLGALNVLLVVIAAPVGDAATTDGSKA
jgi:hypothetical protein